MAGPFPAHYFSRARREVLPLLPAAPGRYLEIGCGTGATLAFLREQGRVAWCAGVEYDAEAARQAAGHVDLLRTGDVEGMDLPVEPGSIDVVLCLDVLEHLRDPWAMLGRVRPLLRPGGTLVVSLPNIRNYKVLARLAFADRFDYADAGILDRTHLRFFTRSTAAEMLRGQGFTVDAVRPLGLKPRKLKWWLNRLSGGALSGLLAEQFLLRARI